MIHPRRLSGSAGNIARYYTVGDYYTKGSQEHSEWAGKVAAELGLEGTVDPATFKELLAGRVAGRQLGRRGADGTIQHHPGWDFAVNAPKSVSIMALVAQDQRVLEAHEQAVGEAISWLEEHAAYRFRRQGEIVHETTGRIIAARFTEHASRELDPHLHTHVVVMNITDREDGAAMTSMETRAMFAEQMVAGQIYRNGLAQKLRAHGFKLEIDPHRGLFEIKGVPKSLIAEWSKRAEQINGHAEEHGRKGQAARVASFYQTRKAKQKTSVEGLQERWDKEAGPILDMLHDVKAAADLDGVIDHEGSRAVAGRAALFGIRNMETREAVNSRGQLIRSGLAVHVGEVSLRDVLPFVKEHEEREKLLATRTQTGDAILTRGRTSRATARLEITLSKHLAMALDDTRPLASTDRLLSVLEGEALSSQQERALAMLATSRDRLIGIHGVAGSGKSTLVRALVAAADADVRVQALAPTSSAAAELGKKANIPSQTVMNLIVSGGQKLDARDLLVVDEAGQLSNRQALRLLEVSRDTGARILFLGDNKQTGAIEQGKAFWLLQQLGLPKAELAVSLRQRNSDKMMKAVKEARLGEYARAIGFLEGVVSGDQASKLATKLVDQWMHLPTETRAATNILVLDNATRITVNANVRRGLQKEGVIGLDEVSLKILAPAGMTSEERRMARLYYEGQAVMFSRDVNQLGVVRQIEYAVIGRRLEGNGRELVELQDQQGRIILWDPRRTRASMVNVFNVQDRGLALGDRIQWRLATKNLGVKNAERGTVERLDSHLATIRWDRTGKRQEVDLSRYKTWDHGYAETVYSSQSKTYPRVFVLAPVDSPLVTGQNFYTAITRAESSVTLWTENRADLVEKLKRNSGQKTSSLEGLDLIKRSGTDARLKREATRIQQERDLFEMQRRELALLRSEQRGRDRGRDREGLAGAGLRATETLTALIESMLRNNPQPKISRPREPGRTTEVRWNRGRDR
ncbi:conjugative relaxase domain-containing protein, TrwC/TraI family [Sphingobium sp. AP50]|uniref:MobF family relaxase n=1 Tax=Sphingobium sp. AP50 TaxID=1884369 RepID=UPI0008B04065|nr:MobF family relaxase [Sphingobium sp. AP50]SEJ91567.1 conjugative relaxase domain-containing protein, TrwC/TraI family [Sphingobium sp. AP50]